MLDKLNRNKLRYSSYLKKPISDLVFLVKICSKNLAAALATAGILCRNFSSKILHHSSASSGRMSILALLSIVTISCSGKKGYFNTEILCPDGSAILVKYARMEEMKEAIIRADLDKKKFRTSETYTVIRLPGNRSFKVEKIPPEEMVNCALKESPIGEADKKYIHYYIP